MMDNPLKNTFLGSSPILITFFFDLTDAGKCMCASFVVACLTLSSIDPVISPPCV